MTPTEEVLQAHQTIFAAHNTGDAETMAKLFHPQFTLFHAEDGLRYDNFDLAMLQALNDAGYKGQVDSRYLDAKVFDNCAVVTCYLSGMFTWAGSGATEHGTWRYTGVWSKEGEAWKHVHAHISRLAPRHSTA
ncbi:MAG: nuclear transport factor 2 family protein [Caldilineaceae bacterium]